MKMSLRACLGTASASVAALLASAAPADAAWIDIFDGETVNSDLIAYQGNPGVTIEDGVLSVEELNNTTRIHFDFSYDDNGIERSFEQLRLVYRTYETNQHTTFLEIHNTVDDGVTPWRWIQRSSTIDGGAGSYGSELNLPENDYTFHYAAPTADELPDDPGEEVWHELIFFRTGNGGVSGTLNGVPYDVLDNFEPANRFTIFINSTTEEDPNRQIDFRSVQVTADPIPEPASIAALSVLGLGLLRRRQIVQG